MKLHWKRPRTEEAELYVRQTWAAIDTDYRVAKVMSKFGLPVRFVAMLGAKRILSSHRARKPAMRACERHARAAVGDTGSRERGPAVGK